MKKSKLPAVAPDPKVKWCIELSKLMKMPPLLVASRTPPPVVATDFAEPDESSGVQADKSAHPKHTTAQPTQLERAGRATPFERRP